jgi:hypothetical protein
LFEFNTSIAAFQIIWSVIGQLERWLLKTFASINASSLYRLNHMVNLAGLYLTSLAAQDN